MMHTHAFALVALAALFLSVVAGATPPTLVDFSDADAREQVRHHNGKLTWTDNALVFSLAANSGGRLSFKPAKGKWNLSGYTRLNVDMAAVRGKEVKIKMVARSAGGRRSTTTWTFLDDGQRAARALYLVQGKATLAKHQQLSVFTNMRGLPGGFFTHWLNLDASSISDIDLVVTPRPYPQELQIYSINAASPIVPTKLVELGKGYFPFIDAYGQYRHADWPGKITSDKQLKRSFTDEKKDLAANPPPADRNKWGGWKDGPQLKKTGFFRTHKLDGRWWLVDPDGRLFWSHGVTGVGTRGASTPINAREHYFSLPAADDKLAQFRTAKEFDFTAANLYRALGDNWKNAYLDLTHKRLASWGMNTMGNWSPAEARLMRRTPYTVAIHYGYRKIGKKLPDPFDPSFRASLRKSLERNAETANDPWCIGYFVNNELHWERRPITVVEKVFAAEPDLHAKQRLIAQLKEKHGEVGKLNAMLKTSFASWDAVLKNRKTIKLAAIKADGDRFYRALCEAYFSTCREEVKRIAPNQLYLGCRIHVPNPILLKAAAKYCDVVSFNMYDYDVSKRWRNLGRPFIIGEFHFGAQDRGMWGLGLCWASSQQGRARLYRDYVRSALSNPNCVGTHWFQYNSQAFTGRRDGENYQVGLTDIGGRPWPELREQVRAVGRDLYQLRK